MGDPSLEAEIGHGRDPLLSAMADVSSLVLDMGWVDCILLGSLCPTASGVSSRRGCLPLGCGPIDFTIAMADSLTWLWPLLAVNRQPLWLPLETVMRGEEGEEAAGDDERRRGWRGDRWWSKAEKKAAATPVQGAQQTLCVGEEEDPVECWVDPLVRSESYGRLHLKIQSG